MSLENIIGATILSITGAKVGSSKLTFSTDKGTLELYHGQCCCEDVCVEDINGDVSDMIGGVVSVADERVGEETEVGWARELHTFYEIRTTKGDMNIRWLGRDNGYYSVSVHYDWTPLSEEVVEDYS